LGPSATASRRTPIPGVARIDVHDDDDDDDNA